MAYDNNRFCWHGFVSTDVAKTLAFYPEVIGFKVIHMDMPEGSIPAFVAGDGVPRGHVRPAEEGEPSYVSSYLRVADVDAAAAAAAENGGSVIVPPTDIAPGRFSTVASPSGATFNLFHEASGDSTNPGKAEGAVAWVELHSTDVDADLAWLNASFGISSQGMPMPEFTYNMLKSGGESDTGGLMPQQHPGAPSMWLVWFSVSDVDACIERAAANGGNTLVPAMDSPWGRMSVQQDPNGCVYGVISQPEG